MRDLYSDDYESVAGGGADRLIPEGVRRLAGAAVFLGLVAALGLWSYRLGTRDAAEVPIIRAMEGPARVEPRGPGRAAGGAPGPRGQRRARRRGRRRCRATTPPPPRRRASLAAEDAPQGELVLAAPAVLAERVLGEGGDLPMPRDEAADDSPRRSLRARALSARREPLRRGPPEARRPRPPTGRRTWSIARAKAAAAAAPAPAARAGRRSGAGAAPRGARGSRRSTPGAPAGAARRLRQRGDHPQGLGASSSPATATCSASKSLYVERTTANARVFYRLRVAGFARHRADAADVRGAARRAASTASR